MKSKLPAGYTLRGAKPEDVEKVLDLLDGVFAEPEALDTPHHK